MSPITNVERITISNGVTGILLDGIEGSNSGKVYIVAYVEYNLPRNFIGSAVNQVMVIKARSLEGTKRANVINIKARGSDTSELLNKMRKLLLANPTLYYIWNRLEEGYYGVIEALG